MKNHNVITNQQWQCFIVTNKLRIHQRIACLPTSYIFYYEPIMINKNNQETLTVWFLSIAFIFVFYCCWNLDIIVWKFCRERWALNWLLNRSKRVSDDRLFFILLRWRISYWSLRYFNYIMVKYVLNMSNRYITNICINYAHGDPYTKSCK